MATCLAATRTVFLGRFALQTIRRAQQDDAECIASLVTEAYTPYISRIGKKPAPMLDDYRQVLVDSDVFVLTDGADIVGVLVMSREQRELLLINVAVLGLTGFCSHPGQKIMDLSCKLFRLGVWVLCLRQEKRNLHSHTRVMLNKQLDMLFQCLRPH